MADQSDAKNYICYCVIAKSHIIHLGTHGHHPISSSLSHLCSARFIISIKHQHDNDRTMQAIHRYACCLVGPPTFKLNDWYKIFRLIPNSSMKPDNGAACGSRAGQTWCGGSRAGQIVTVTQPNLLRINMQSPNRLYFIHRNNGQVNHCRIHSQQQNGLTYYYLVNAIVFDSLYSLVLHYQKYPLRNRTTGFELQLTDPILHPNAHESKE